MAPEEEQPLPLGEAAQAVGLHPNSIRRLIHQGRIDALLIKGEERDSWLVDVVALRRVLAERHGTGGRRGGPGGRPAAAGAPPRDSGGTEDRPPVAGRLMEGENTGAGEGDRGPFPIASLRVKGGLPFADGSERTADWIDRSIDLSLERAQALERYTHGLLTPLIELLREREQAVERREAMVRLQAERIGRLELQVELLQGQLGEARRAAPAAPTGDSALGDETAALARQVSRFQEQLSLLSRQLDQRLPPAPAAANGDQQVPVVPTGEAPAPAPEAPPAASPISSAPVTPAANLETGSSSRVPADVPSPPGPLPHEGGSGSCQVDTATISPVSTGLLPSPLVGEGSGGEGDQPAGTEAPAPASPAAAEAATSSTESWAKEDPFADAEEAIRELQRALLAQGGQLPTHQPPADAAASPLRGAADADETAVQTPPTVAEELARAEQSLAADVAPAPRRPWWRFW